MDSIVSMEIRGRVESVSLLEIQRMRSWGWDSEEMVQIPLGNCSINTRRTAGTVFGGLD
jgi:hypothetical protein